MGRICLVTGANGHLGANLVRVLLENGRKTLAVVRRDGPAQALAGLDVETRRADLLDRTSLEKAFEGADVVCHAAAVFRHWAADGERDIYEANVSMTRNVIGAARRAGASRVVYVSSLGAADKTRSPITEAGWNEDRSNVYFRSKTDSEKLAFDLAGSLGVDMVSVLPSAMIGGNLFRLTPTMSLLDKILKGTIPVNPGFYFNFVDVRDVAKGVCAAAEKGRAGERYILASERCFGMEEIVRIARRVFPDRKIKEPIRAPRLVVYPVAAMMEAAGALLGVEPLLQRNFLRVFSHRETCDTSKARKELGFNPKPPEAAIEGALKYLAER